ncbi:cation:proton antiporter [Patescibacteria group bacterium]|nr:cation:proton antiporter [Patescibacteria group bacterium]
MEHSLSLITTFLLLLAAALGGGAIAVRLRLPSIVGYITGGILVGNVFPQGFDHRLITMIAEAGVTLLLFTLGVEFSFHRLKRILHVVAWPAIGQIVMTLFIVMLALIALKTPFIPALFLASAAALSSTAIVVKLLSERGELDSVPGELSTGWLVVQDLAVVPILILLSALSSVANGEGTVISVLGTIAFAMLKASVLILVVLYLGSRGVPKLLGAVAGFKNRELFLLTTIGIVFLVGLLTYAVGLSVSLGAFIAGLLVAETSQNHAVFAEIRPLRDLFAVVFFVSLGMALPVSALVSSLPVIIVMTIAVILVKGGSIYTLLRFLGYHRKTAFLVGIYLTQVSEFGFIIAGMGIALGALSEAQSSLLVAVTFITILISSPLISNGHKAYYFVHNFLKKIPKTFRDKEEEVPRDTGYPIQDHVVICGYGRVGKYIGRALQMSNVPFLVVDYNQHTLAGLRGSGIQTIYGDPADKDVLDYAQVDLAKSIIIAIPDRHTQEMVIGNALSLNRRIKIICRTHHEEDQRHLKSLGVQTVIQPEFEAALTIVNKLLNDFGVPPEEMAGKMSRLKIEHGIG